MSQINEFARKMLSELESQNLYRNLKFIEKISGTRITINGREYISFVSNDYLGLSQSVRLKAVLKDAVSDSLLCAPSSRLLAGTTALHRKLEKKMSEFKESEEAVMFTSAYMANIGLIVAVSDEDTIIFSDELNHASLIDACRLSKARVVIYPHNGCESLERHLKSADPAKRKIILTETLFSMLGDVAPLGEISNLAKKFDADVIVDDAHGTGVFGPEGKGVIHELGLQNQIKIQVCNLSKAGGFFGGFVLCPENIAQLLINRARTFIYTTAIPPFICKVGLACVDLIRSAEKEREKLRSSSRYLIDGLKRIGYDIISTGPILAIILGAAQKAVSVSNFLLEKGLYVPAIRPPSVPDDKSCLRISITAVHEKEQIDGLLDALEQV